METLIKQTLSVVQKSQPHKDRHKDIQPSQTCHVTTMLVVDVVTCVITGIVGAESKHLQSLNSLHKTRLKWSQGDINDQAHLFPVWYTYIMIRCPKWYINEVFQLHCTDATCLEGGDVSGCSSFVFPFVSAIRFNSNWIVRVGRESGNVWFKLIHIGTLWYLCYLPLGLSSDLQPHHVIVVGL